MQRIGRTLDELLVAGVAAGLIRKGVEGRVVLRALGGICGMQARSWQDAALEIVTILHDGLRYGAGHRADRDTPSVERPV